MVARDDVQDRLVVGEGSPALFDLWCAGTERNSGVRGPGQRFELAGLTLPGEDRGEIGAGVLGIQDAQVIRSGNQYADASQLRRQGGDSFPPNAEVLLNIVAAE